MTTITESFTQATTQATSQAAQATEKSVETWKQGALTLTEQTGALTRWTNLDLTKPVERYFEFVHQSVDVNRAIVLRWVSAVSSITGGLRGQAKKAEIAVRDNVTTIADATVEQAEQVEQFVDEQTNEG